MQKIKDKEKFPKFFPGDMVRLTLLDGCSTLSASEAAYVSPYVG